MDVILNDASISKIADEIMRQNDREAIEEVPETELVPDLRQEPEKQDGLFTHTVESVPVWVEWNDGTFHKVNGFHGINRQPKSGQGNGPEILHVAPITTTVIGMGELESIAEQLIEAGYEYHNHGELKSNRWLFIELEHPDLPKLTFEGTSLVPKMFLGSSHDGTLAMKSTVKIVDTICYNTFMMNHKSDLLFKTKHTKNASLRIKEYEQGLADASELLNQYYDAVSVLNDTPFTGKARIEQYFAGSIGATLKERKKVSGGKEYMSPPEYSGKHKNQIEQLFESYEYGTGQKERGATLWSAFSAVTDWCDNHEANKKSVQMGTNLVGNRARQKQTAWALANHMAKSA